MQFEGICCLKDELNYPFDICFTKSDKEFLGSINNLFY